MRFTFAAMSKATIPSSSFEFLKQLKKHNNRDWSTRARNVTCRNMQP